MKKPAERTERWIEVEALCRCAQLERQFGDAMSEHLMQIGEDQALVAEMRRLCEQRRRWRRLRMTVSGLLRRIAAMVTAQRMAFE